LAVYLSLHSFTILFENYLSRKEPEFARISMACRMGTMAQR